MTAPDDVRAYKTPRAAFNQYRSREFEAADAEGGWTFRPAPYAAFLAGWNAHRAAHADLSGEVRELVEAARVVADERHTHSALGSKDGGESCGICGHNWRSGVHLRAGESEQADKLRLKAALAKFNQEKKA